jgi:protein tyrosine phosphatase
MENKLNQKITDTELNPFKVFMEKNITVNGQWNTDNGEFNFETPNGETVSQSQYDTWKSEKSIEDWKINSIDEIKASAKQKLINGEPLTEDEANVMIGL